MIPFHDCQGWDVAYINPKELGEGFGRVMLVRIYNEYIYIYARLFFSASPWKGFNVPFNPMRS